MLCAATLLSGCTGAVDQNQIRKGNYRAPEDYKVAENCDSKNTDKNSTECKVIISYPDDQKPNQEESKP